MPLMKGSTTKPTASEAAGAKAKDTFARLNDDTDFTKLKQTSETIACRVPKGERLRLRLLFARHGLTLSEGIKAAIYAYIKTLE